MKKMKIYIELVCDRETGELSTRDYTEIPIRKNLRGGFNIVYMNEYEKASVNVVYSNLDFRLLSQIRSLFKKTQTEVSVPISKLAKNNNTSRQTVSKVINKMLQADMLIRVSRGIYRFNPYMYIPYGGDGETLQKEWNELKIEDKKSE
jgi:hypothetical protein